MAGNKYSIIFGVSWFTDCIAILVEESFNCTQITNCTICADVLSGVK